MDSLVQLASHLVMVLLLQLENRGFQGLCMLFLMLNQVL
jgi:hypothetical protein